MPALNPIYIPIKDLTLPPLEVLQYEFNYSDLPSPSLIHALILGDVRKQVSKIHGKVNRRKVVNVGILDYLMPLAARKPHGPVLSCSKIGHRFCGYRFICGRGDHKTTNIGWWQQIVSQNTILPSLF
jgi:hypothetical protein